MGFFFEFGRLRDRAPRSEDEMLEASGPTAARPAPSGGSAGRTGSGSSTTPSRSSNTGSSGSASGRAAPTGGTAAAASGRSRTPAATSPTSQGGRATTGPSPAPGAGGRPAPATPASPATPAARGGGFNFASFGPALTQGFDLFQRGTQIVQQVGALTGPGGASAGPGPSGPTPGDAGQPAGVDAPAAGGPAVPGGPPALDQPTPAAPPTAYGPPSSYGQPVGYGQAVGYGQPAGYGQPTGYFPQPFQPQYLVGAGQPAAGFDQLGMLLQALQQRQIPPLPGQPSQAPPTATPPVQQPDGLGLLRLILGHPQFQQALQWGAVMGSAAPRTVQLPLPAAGGPGRMRSAQIPMGAVMNAIYGLAGQSMVELNESTREDEPEVPSYLVGDDGHFIVDPASPDDRAALVAHLFRVSDEAQRSGWFQPADGGLSEADGELDESEEFARDAGFTR